MKYLLNVFRLTFFMGLYVAASLQTVYAEDTEIFFTPPSNTATAKPNIMFIIDSSGSMGWGVSGTTDSRMEVVQDVMDEVLTSITNVNAGLMRFNNGRPGPVIFPVVDIELPATPTVFQTISNGGNDAENFSTGIVDATSNTLEFNDSNRYVGIRFEQLNIPQGATIISANILLSAERDATGPKGDIEITGENIDNAPPIDPTVLDELRLRARSPLATNARKFWNMGDWVKGSIYASPDLSTIIEEIVARPGWCGGNAIMLFFLKDFTSSNVRYAYSKEGVDALPNIDPDDPRSVFSPRIKIEYSQTFNPTANKCMTNEAVSQVSQQGDDYEIRQDGSINTGSPDLDFYLDSYGSDQQQGIGLIFKNITVPQGATIRYAYLSFTADENKSGTTDVDIELVDADNVSSPANNTTRKNLFTSANKTAQVNWTFSASWITGQVYRSVDISPIVNTVINRSGWNLNNNMAVFVRGNAGRHVADSFSGTAPRLVIGFTGIWQPGVNTIRDDLKAAVAGLVPSGGTPISGTYAEAGKYFRGDGVFYGASRNGNRFSRVSHEQSYSSTGTVLRATNCTDANLNASACSTETITGSPRYRSPITESCQTNHIVFLTDGSSNSHLGSTNNIYNSWTGGSGTCSSANGGNDCSIKMAKWLNTNDVAPGISGNQFVNTYMIGFGPSADPALMKLMAQAGGTGAAFSADNRDELVTAINAIVGDIATTNSTFVTAGVTVNQFNRVTNNNERYFSLFEPVNKGIWPGNIKRYEVSNRGLVDAAGNAAVDTSGEFISTAQSFWSATPDGNDIERGGAAEQLGLNRKVYSNIASDNLAIDPVNALKQSNSSITTAVLGGVTPQRRDSILYWASGKDVNDSAYNPADASSLASTPTRKDIGDPLHSQPVLIEYNDTSGNVSSTRIYVGTNHGFLHSFDASNGSEAWAFVPKDLLSKLDSVITNAASTSHTYGLDGSAALYLDDANSNGAADPGDKVYLYIGQRRGGSSYYALDVSDPDRPVFMFQISNSGAFSGLGQTWSKPVISKMNLPGVNADKLVMIFGGGYDLTQDNPNTSAATDSIGNNVYIADALTGALLWEAKGDALPHGGLAGSISEMNSVPSGVSAFDLTNDGLIDNIYATDTKAQVFRFDVDNVARTIKGGRIANLQGAGGAANNRRFFSSADAVLIRDVGDSFIAVSIGSGYRAHPLDLNVEDSFYVLKDTGVLTGVYDMDATVADLQDVTSLADSSGNGISDAVELLNDATLSKKGWYIDLSSTPGEKVLARSITFNNAVLFTTYIPPSGALDVCKAAAGGGRLYALNILNGNPYLDTNQDGTLDENDRLFELDAPGIAPQVDITIDEDGLPLVSVGREYDITSVPLPPPGIMGYKWKKNN